MGTAQISKLKTGDPQNLDLKPSLYSPKAKQRCRMTCPYWLPADSFYQLIISQPPPSLLLPSTVFTASFSSGPICLTALRGMTYLPWMLLRQRFYYDVEYNASRTNSRFSVRIFMKWNIPARNENLAQKLFNLSIKTIYIYLFR